MMPRLQRSLLEVNPRVADSILDRQRDRILELMENPLAAGNDSPWNYLNVEVMPVQRA
jgi:hypothetical protein